MSAWSHSEIPDLSAKTFVVTGGNSGIGLEAARVLAQKGADVVLACRSQEKGRAAIESIRAVAPDAKLELGSLDLASLKSVRAFADKFRSSRSRLDGLLNNAGLMAIPLARTEDGFEMQIGTNHLGHFALTGLLLPTLLATPGSRVVSVASQAHRWASGWDDLNCEKSYWRWPVYGRSKLANLLFAFELQRRLERKGASTTALACHPGYSATELQGKGATLGGSKFEAWFMGIGNGMLAQTAVQGAWPTLRAATDPNAKGGEYYGPGGPFELAGPPVPVTCTTSAKDEAAARKLWDESARLTGVTFDAL